MKLYEVTNGYTGFSYVRCYVVAENEERARELATKEYQKHTYYKESYWKNLTVEFICDCDKEFVGEIKD